MRPADPARYGRVITHGDTVERIVEWADATAAERAVGLCNAGVICAAAADLRSLAACGPQRQQQGRILPDGRGRYRPGRGRAGGRCRGAGGRVARGELPRRTRGGGGHAAGFLRRGGDGGGCDLHRAGDRVPVGRHGAGAGRDGGAERGVRPWRDRGARSAKSARSATWRAAPSVRTPSSARSPGCAPAPRSALRPMSATSWS